MRKMGPNIEIDQLKYFLCKSVILFLFPDFYICKCDFYKKFASNLEMESMK